MELSSILKTGSVDQLGTYLTTHKLSIDEVHQVIKNHNPELLDVVLDTQRLPRSILESLKTYAATQYANSMVDTIQRYM